MTAARVACRGWLGYNLWMNLLLIRCRLQNSGFPVQFLIVALVAPLMPGRLPCPLLQRAALTLPGRVEHVAGALRQLEPL
jgi:hypothetical protein